MSSYFSGTLAGNIGKDAELKYLADGTAVATFAIATNRGRGEKEITTWTNISYYGKVAVSIAPYLKKGTLVMAAGQVSNRPYDKEGATRYSLEMDASSVQLLGSRVQDGDEPATPQVKSTYVSNPTAPF